jgi:hypothetical protein
VSIRMYWFDPHSLCSSIHNRTALLLRGLSDSIIPSTRHAWTTRSREIGEYGADRIDILMESDENLSVLIACDRDESIQIQRSDKESKWVTAGDIALAHGDDIAIPPSIGAEV